MEQVEKIQYNVSTTLQDIMPYLNISLEYYYDRSFIKAVYVCVLFEGELQGCSEGQQLLIDKDYFGNIAHFTYSLKALSENSNNLAVCFLLHKFQLSALHDLESVHRIIQGQIELFLQKLQEKLVNSSSLDLQEDKSNG